jgi:hypothetical protein
LEPTKPPIALNVNGLFESTNLTRDIPLEPHISRARFVTIDREMLLYESGHARGVKGIVFNLFPDVIYRGVIQEIDQTGDEVIWSGYIQDVEYGYFTLVFTSGVFMGHFGGSRGIYEVVFEDESLYRVIEIDQTKFPGGEY